MTRAAIYARISDDREGTRAGVDRQIDDCTALIERNGWTLASSHVDNDISAYSGKARPEWLRLHDQVEAGAVDVIVSYAADRLTRQPRELEDLVDLLESTGTKVATITSGDYDLCTADGRAMARIMGTIARQSSEKSSERVKRAQAQAAAEGRPHGGRRRFGYEKNGRTIVKPEADAIRTGVADFLAGKSLSQIARDWNAAGVTTPRGMQWNATTARDVLDNPRLAGLRTYQGRVVGPGDWDPIIEESTHRALIAVFTDPNRKRNGAPSMSLLGGIATCGECGGVMHQQRRSGDNAPIYRCDMRSGCGQVSAVAKHVDRIVTEAFLAVIVDPANVEKITAGDAGKDRSREIADELAALDDRERSLGERLVAGDISDLVLQGAQAAIGAQRAELETELRAEETGQPILTGEQLHSLAGMWDRVDRADRRAAIEVVIEKVTVSKVTRRTGNVFDPDRVTIEYLGGTA